MSEPDRTRLPIRRDVSGGVQPDAGRLAARLEPDRAPAPPEGAPNVLLVLIDDAGFGNPSTFGGPIRHPELHADRRGRAALQPVPCHRAVLADPRRAADRPQQPRRRLRLDRRVRRRLPGLLRDRPARLRAAARGSCATTATARPRSGSGTSRPTASKARPARSTGGPTAGASTTSTGSWAAGRASGIRAWPRTRRSSAPRGVLRQGRTRTTSPTPWPTGPSSGCTGCAPRTPDKPFFVYFSTGLQPRPAPRAPGMGGQVQGQVRPGLGQAARGDLRPPEGARGRSRPTPSSRRETRPSRPGTTCPTS